MFLTTFSRRINSDVRQWIRSLTAAFSNPYFRIADAAFADAFLGKLAEQKPDGFIKVFIQLSLLVCCA